jgi:hypothetical protein
MKIAAITKDKEIEAILMILFFIFLLIKIKEELNK